MRPTVFVISAAFLKAIPKNYGTTPADLNDCRVVAISDTFGGSTVSDGWDNLVVHVLDEVKRERPPLLLVIAHSPVFAGTVTKLETQRPDYRVPPAENDLRERLGKDAPPLTVTGFHHDEQSDVYRFLFTPEILKRTGALTQLRRIVENGGGPIGRLSILKHELMRPFASIGLLLQVRAEEEEPPFDAALIARIEAVVAEGRGWLAGLDASTAGTPEEYIRAVGAARSLLDVDVAEITASPDAFHGWKDRLDASLNDIREVVR